MPIRASGARRGQRGQPPAQTGKCREAIQPSASAAPIVLSVLIESIVLSLRGGIVGAAAAWLVFDGVRTATINWQTFSQVAFDVDVDVPLLVRGIVTAVVIGVVGGLFPAIRAARLPVAVALRER